MNKRILSLLLAFVLAITYTNIYAEYAEDWQNYQISVSNANNTETIALPVENASTHAYWIKLAQEDSLEGLKLHISHQAHENYSYYPANASDLTGLVDANGTLDGSYLAVQVFNEKGEQVDTILLYFSKMAMPEVEKNVTPANVNVLYKDATGELIAQETRTVENLGANIISANHEIIPAEYKLADEETKTVELKDGGLVEPQEIVFTLEKQAGELGADVIVEYLDKDGNNLVSEQIRVNKLGENIINANTELIPEGYSVDGESSKVVNLSENNIVEPSTVKFLLKSTEEKQISASVSVVYVDKTGEYLNSEQVTLNKVGKSTITANQSLVPEGYSIEGADTQEVELYDDGTLSTDQVTFTYTKSEKTNELEAVTITLSYVDEEGNEIKPSSKTDIKTVGEHTITAEYPEIEGYELVSPKNDVVTMFDDNTVDKTNVVFSYKSNETKQDESFNPVKITVHYIDSQTNADIKNPTEKVFDKSGQFDVTPEYQSIDGYKLVGQGSQRVVVYEDGSASTVEIYFTYEKISEEKPAENQSEENKPSDTENQDTENPTENSTENQNTDFEGKKAIVNAKSVNVRKKPSTNADQIRQLKKGTEVTILEVVEDKKGIKWAKIEYGNKRTGYMQMEFIDLSTENSNENTETPAKSVNAKLKVQYINKADQSVLYEYDVNFDTSGEQYVDIRNVNETQGYTLQGEQRQKVVVDEQGNVSPNPLVFTFTKSEINAEVIRHYLDVDGAKIAEDTTKQFQEAGDYTLLPEQDITGYELVEPISYAVYVDANGNATPSDVVFKYRKKDVVGTVSIEYVDENGEKIAEDSVSLDRIGTHQITPQRMISDYDLIGKNSFDVELKSDGTVAPSTVTFSYKKKEVKISANVYIKYEDESGNVIASPSSQTFDKAGTFEVSPNATVPANYELVGDSKQSVVVDENGVATPSELVFVYKKNDVLVKINAKLKVRYIDTNSNSIAQDDIVTFTEVGEKTVKPKLVLNGYILQNQSEKVQVNADNTVSPNEISFMYEQIMPKNPEADVHVMYVDENGTPIAKNTIQKVNVVGNNTIVPKANNIPEKYQLIGKGQINVVLYADGTADPNPAIFVYKNTEENFEHWKGYALSNSRVALRNSLSSSDKAIVRNLDRNTLLYISGQQKYNGIIYHSVQLLNGENGFIMDSDITRISAEEAEKYRNEYLNSLKPKEKPVVPSQTGYAMTLGNIPFRQFASGYSNIMQELYSGTVVFLNGKVEYNEDKAWYVAQYNNKLGYVRSDQVRMLSQLEISNYLKNNNEVKPLESQAPQYNPQGLSSYGYVTSGDVNFRVAASKQSRAIGKIKRYGMGLILETSNINGTTWYKINFDGRVGYVQGDYFKSMTLDEFNKFIKSREYRQGIQNNLEMDTGSSNAPVRKPKYDPGVAKPGKPQTIEDYNTGIWRNPNLARASYEPFRPNITPMPDVDQIEVSPTPTMIVDPAFSIDVVEESPTASVDPSESIEPLDTEPVTETTESSSPLVFIVIILIIALGGAVAYAAIMKKKRMRFLESQKEKHNMRNMAQRQGMPNRQTQATSATPRDPYANPTSYGTTRPEANQFRPRSEDAFKKPVDNVPGANQENTSVDNNTQSPGARRRR